MEPLSRNERDKIVQSHPDAAPEDVEESIDEYERLLAARFEIDPDAIAPELGVAGDPDATFDVEDRETRLKELFEYLFNPAVLEKGVDE